MNRRWLLTAAVSLIVFIIVQVVPPAAQAIRDAQDGSTLTRTEAKRSAETIAANQFGIDSSRISEVIITHLSDSQTVGYLSKEQKVDEFNKVLDKSYPTDVYRADIKLGQDNTILSISINMESGKLIEWMYVANPSDTALSDLKDNQDDTLESDRRQAREFATAAWGVAQEDWDWSASQAEDGSFDFPSRKTMPGELKLYLHVKAPENYALSSSAWPASLGSYIQYHYEVPESYTAYIDRQEKLASWLSGLGFLLPQLILFVLSIVYAALLIRHTSFLRGIFLSVMYFVFYAVVSFNMIPGFRAALLDGGGDAGGNRAVAMVVVNLFIYLGMAALTYFSAVAGDGLWKSMGFSLWPRWRERSYGNTVLRSMMQGYPLALILLGVQSIVLLVLTQAIGSFSSSDDTQSSYNMIYPWLLPLLAWCAGTSEELQTRFFGYGLFRKWLLGIARKVTGKEPSALSTQWLTFAAMLPPGLVWAFGHVTYAVYPVYTRLIELVIMALLFGWFMLRFGLIAVIFTHIIFDSTLMCAQMLFDGMPGDSAAGVLAFILPAIVGIVIWWLHKIMRGNKLEAA